MPNHIVTFDSCPWNTLAQLDTNLHIVYTYLSSGAVGQIYTCHSLSLQLDFVASDRIQDCSKCIMLLFICIYTVVLILPLILAINQFANV